MIMKKINLDVNEYSLFMIIPPPGQHHSFDNKKKIVFTRQVGVSTVSDFVESRKAPRTEGVKRCKNC